MPWLERLNDHKSRHLARQLSRSATETRQLAREHLQQFAHGAGEIAGHATQELADYARTEGAAIAGAATQRVVRAGRAIKADPVPVIVGVVGAVLLANLLFGRRAERPQ